MPSLDGSHRLSSRQQFLAVLLLLLASLAGCNGKPYQTSPFGVCGGHMSEHDIKQVADVWVANRGTDELVFFYTNVTKTPQQRPIFSRADRDSLYYLHVQYADVTVGCLENTRFGNPDTDPSPMMAPGVTVSGVFKQDRVIKAIENETPDIVTAQGAVVRFNYDGYATNACTVEGTLAHKRLVCEVNTRKERRRDNRDRQAWLDRFFGVFGDRSKERWGN